MEDGGSFRISSSSIWRNSDAAEIFSNSFHQEDDEEALKWAAIQKLPTFARLRKGLLTSLQGEAIEIDIEKLGLQERKDLLDRLVRLAEEDNEKFLLKLKGRMDRVGIDLPTIEVRFEHLNIKAEARVGSRSLPTFTNFMVNIVEGLLNSLHVLPSRKQHPNILKDVSGIIKPSSSGKTTLLLALAGKLDQKLKVSGKVTYNGHEMSEFVPQRTAAYVDQNDLHTGEMTVRETLAFSARVQGVGPRYDLLAELSRREKHANIKPDPDVDVYMKLLLLKQGGQEIYVGPLGHDSSNLINYFEGIQGVSKIKDGYNPAIWMLEVTTSSKEVELGIDFAEVYQNSELYRRNKALIKELSTPAPGSKDLYFPSHYSRSFLTQCMACLWKQHWSYWRNSEYNAVRFLYSTAVAVLLGSMFWDLGSKIEKEQDPFNVMGSMYSAVLLIGVRNGNTVQAVVAVERAAGMYSAFPYAFAQVIIELPYVFIQSMVYGIIVYAMIGFKWTVVKVLWCLFFLFFTFLYFTYYGMMSVAMTPNNHISIIASSAFYSVWNLFSGFVVPRPSRFSQGQNCKFAGWERTYKVGREIFEYSSVVEVVQLGQSSGLEFVWIGGFTIWRCKAKH